MHVRTIERFINLLDPAANVILNMSPGEAEECVASGQPERVRSIAGQFALVHKSGNIVRMARSIGRPMRYFLAKQTDGPCLVVAERMDEILDFLRSEGLADQFHPSYTRMVPAHHVLELALVGCPDPTPTCHRFLAPQRNSLPSDLEVIGKSYIEAVTTECDRWLNRMDNSEPIGVMFSGGVDSGAVFMVLHHLLMLRGQPQRLKAFTLSVDGVGDDSRQAFEFLESLDLTMFLETVEVAREDIRFEEAIAVVEDYKPLDIQSACMGLALCRGIRARYPDWKYLVDGDGGDENLKDYPIEENPELTIRSVLNNLMLYHEGWGIDAVKHSLTYSGGQSRGHVRTYAPARRLGFQGFSPFALPNVIEVSESIPFIELTDWQHERLYSLKGEVARRGIRALTGLEMPVFEKRRFQQGATTTSTFPELFPTSPHDYRAVFSRIFEPAP